MIQTEFDRNVIHVEWDGGFCEENFDMKVVRAKTYTKVVIYNFSYIGYKEHYTDEHEEDGITHKKIKKYHNGIEYKRKWRAPNE